MYVQDIRGIPKSKPTLKPWMSAGYLFCSPWRDSSSSHAVTVPTVTLARKVGPGLQDLQTRARRILAERNAEKAEENTWIGRMIAAENINELEALIKSRDSS